MHQFWPYVMLFVGMVVISFVAVVSPPLGLLLAIILLGFIVTLHAHRKEQINSDYAKQEKMFGQRKRKHRLPGMNKDEDEWGLFNESTDTTKKPGKKSHGSYDNNPDKAPPLK